MSRLILLAPSILFFITVINYFAIRKPRLGSTIAETVSVLIPLRNEAENVAELIQTLSDQQGLSKVEFILLNDNSEDDTFELITTGIAGRPNFHLIQGTPLPSGWIGKTWALQQLFQASSGEIIVSIDADVRISPEAINKSITLMKSASLDFVSPYPRQIAITFGERLIQPLLQWSWMSTLLLPIAERAPFSSMAVANGQFFLVRRSSLMAVGGYESVKAAVLDDVFLARALIGTGAHGVVINGADIADCRMYSSWNEIESGYGKSLRYAFGSIVGSFFAILFLFITGIAPLALALAGSTWGWFAFVVVSLTRVLSAMRARTHIVDSLLHPISSALLIYLIFYSYLKRGEIQWKGRTL